MAIKEREYQFVSINQMVKCIKWCQNVLNLRDWEVDLRLGSKDFPHTDYGSIYLECEWRMCAEIWVDDKLHKKDKVNPYRTICHEMIHVFTMGKCKIEAEKTEPISYCFEDILYEKYCKFAKIKTMPLKKN